MAEFTAALDTYLWCAVLPLWRKKRIHAETLFYGLSPWPWWPLQSSGTSARERSARLDRAGRPRQDNSSAEVALGNSAWPDLPKDAPTLLNTVISFSVPALFKVTAGEVAPAAP